MQFADLSYAHKLLAGFGLSTVVLQLFLIACQNVLKARSHYVSVFLHAYIAYECRKSANTFLKGGKISVYADNKGQSVQHAQSFK